MSEPAKAQLPALLKGLHELIENELGIARAVVAHSTTKGDVSEGAWTEMLKDYLPSRYQMSRAFVIDSKNQCSEQIDVVVHDRQYSPFVFKHRSALYVPAESVYAAFEVKQEMTAGQVEYAAKKIASVRRLHRTSVHISHAGGKFDPKPPLHIIGGLLCLTSSWSPPLGGSLQSALHDAHETGRLDMGCSARNGVFEAGYSPDGAVSLTVHETEAPLAYFLFRLIACLQTMGTVPSLDVMAYARCLERSV